MLRMMGGSWLWSPMSTTRLRRAESAWRTSGMKVSTSSTWAASSISTLS